MQRIAVIYCGYCNIKKSFFYKCSAPIIVYLSVYGSNTYSLPPNELHKQEKKNLSPYLHEKLSCCSAHQLN